MEKGRIGPRRVGQLVAPFLWERAGLQRGTHSSYRPRKGCGRTFIAVNSEQLSKRKPGRADDFEDRSAGSGRAARFKISG